jgi:hypothetical protein
MIGWVLGGAGIVGLYAAYKDQSPYDILKDALTGESNGRRKIADIVVPHVQGTAPITGGPLDVGFGSSDASSYISAPDPTGPGTDQKGSGSVVSARAEKLAKRQITPTLVPIPWQPVQMGDYEAVKSLVKASAQLGVPIWVTSMYRSYATQAKQHAANPNQFADPNTSGHVVGIAIDVDANKINVADARFNSIMHQNGWFNVAHEGDAVHYSYGYPI